LSTELFETIKKYEQESSHLVATAKKECMNLNQKFEDEKEQIKNKAKKEWDDIQSQNQKKVEQLRVQLQIQSEQSFEKIQHKAMLEYEEQLPTIVTTFLKSVGYR
jgi:F0F1-type ATP synthase membrane subunit b/b'